MTRWTTALLALGAGVLAMVAAALYLKPPGGFGALLRGPRIDYVLLALAAGAFYAPAVWLVRKKPMPAWAMPAILAVGLAARLMVLAYPPLLSTDIYRYVWDGKVQAAGINPYRYLPVDPALEALRDPGAGATAIFNNINRAEYAPTIYPPAAQALFALVGLTAPNIWTMKTVMLAFDLGATLAGLALLRMARLPHAQILVWAWNPLVIWELTGGGHIDAAAVALSALALLAAARARPTLAGAALAGAVLFKLLPAALFPALWRRWDWRTPLAAAALIAAGYACYASVGLRVFGYLPGYANEEGLDGSGFMLMRLLALLGPLPPLAGTLYLAAGLLLLAGLAAWIGLGRPLPAPGPVRATVIARDALILSGALLAVLSPHYPWYVSMLVLPAIIVPAWSALWITLAAPLLYLDANTPDVLWPALVYLPALPLLALDLYVRRAPVALAEGAF